MRVRFDEMLQILEWYRQNNTWGTAHSAVREQWLIHIALHQACCTEGTC
jgi:hypothetical protein